jgi:hypothetical protein
MARDAQSVEQYWQELVKKHGISEESAGAVLKVLKDEKAGKAFLEGFVPQSDYSRDLDKTRDEWKGKLTEAEKKVLGYDDWYKGAKATFDATVTQAQANEARLKKYQDTFGALDDSDGTPKLPPDTVTRKEMEEMVSRLSGNTAKVIKELTHAATDHIHRFGTTLDVEAFEKFMVENNLAPRDAYERFVAPKLAEKQTAEVEARVKREREEAVRDYASKHKMPVDEKPREVSPFFDRREPEKGTTEAQQQRHSRNTFLETLRQPVDQKTA